MLDLPELNFSEEDLTPRSVPVTIGKDTYQLREASGGAGTEYRNRQIACTELGSDGKAKRILGIADCDVYLVFACLFDENGKQVSETKIRNWPDKILRNLVKAAKMLSGLSDQEDASVESLLKKREELDKQIASTRAKADQPDPTKSGSN
jgi:hypothetical protein